MSEEIRPNADDAQSVPAQWVPPTHWTSLEELHGSDEVQRLKGEEFYSKPQTFFDQKLNKLSLTGEPTLISEAAGFMELSVKNNGGEQAGFSRRDFLKISGAAMVFATAGCALRPAQKIIPYVKAPEEVIPGVANYYASTAGGPEAIGVLIKTREGRPIKIEGNPDHPVSQGKLTVRGQLSVFNLYDPDRLQGAVKINRGSQDGVPMTFATADEEIGKALKEAKGQVALLTETIHGPARMRVIREFLAAFPAGRHVEYDAWTNEATRSAQDICYSTKDKPAAVLPHYRFERAEYILNLGADYLGSGYSTLEWRTGFGQNRKIRDGKMSKVVTFEPFMTITGSNSDERLKVRSSDLIKVALAVANQLVGQSSLSGNAQVKSALSKYSADPVEKELNLPSGTIRNVAKGLWANRGKGLVMAGEDQSLQIAANLLNSVCDNDGRTVDGTMSPSRQSHGDLDDMLDLIADMKAGKVDVLIISGPNPAYWLPASSGFVEATKKVKTIISLNDRIDESSVNGDYVLPGLHWLENWGDAEPQAGMYSLMQPAIYPLWDNRAAEDSLIAFAKAANLGTLAQFDGGWHEFLMDTWNKEVYQKGSYLATFDHFWISALRDGVLNTVTDTEGTPRDFNPDAVQKIKVPTKKSADLELAVYPSPNLGDGTDGNNAWLLETPDPVSRISWTNYASMSPKTAEKFGLREGDFVKLEASGVSVELPTHVQPGDLDGIISVQCGWGRSHVGRVGDGAGANAFAFRQLSGGQLISSGIACTLTKTGKWERIPCMQGHNYIEGRNIVAETSLEEYLKDPKAGHHEVEKLESMWTPHEYPGYRWGMSIDLNSCIGCNACISACQVENNIPVVGKEQILMGREMHWMRIDRYYSGEPENPDFTNQPMLCQHCENAPCETVCPVLATVHNDEGLNLQVYNRCVGTRYCSNNCPYKARRFNWFEFSLTAYGEQPLQLVLNPDVTVREKGVMEKCTFCQQRIREGKENAKQFGRKVTDNDIKTACQQTCPTGAITFGDINNPDSQVSKNMKDERSYRVIEEENTRPSIAYWTKVRNRPAYPIVTTGPYGETEGKNL